jgi:uncharacterized integral membrane protein
MRIWTLLLIVVFAFLTVFALLNVNAFLAPTSLSLGFTQVQAPLGLVMLGVVALVSAIFLAFVAYVQGGALLEGRRLSREMEAQRTLADRAEESRFVDLQGRLAQTERALHQRIDRFEEVLLGRLSPAAPPLPPTPQ